MSITNYPALVNSIAASALAAIANASAVGVNHPRHIAVTADMTLAAWNTVASHEVFTVTGMVRLQMWVQVVTELNSALDGASIQIGTELDTTQYMASSVEGGFTTGSLLSFTGGNGVDRGPINDDQEVLKDEAVYGSDIGYEITGEALTSGNLIFHCVWDQLSTGATVTAGDGSPL